MIFNNTIFRLRNIDVNFQSDGFLIVSSFSGGLRLFFDDVILFSEAKKEEKKEESESEDDDMGFGLFDWKLVHLFLLLVFFNK